LEYDFTFDGILGNLTLFSKGDAPCDFNCKSSDNECPYITNPYFGIKRCKIIGRSVNTINKKNYKKLAKERIKRILKGELVFIE
jgi:hypothetical protein